jgi:hypothetical protein
MMDKLTVWCVCVGTKYHPGYVYALKEMVEKNLTIPHTFKCITTEKMLGINTVLPFAPYQGWWSKINLFAPRRATGPSLYFDLDVVITGNIDYLAYYADEHFAAPANWARSGHGGIQSSVMAWRGNWTHPMDQFDYQRDQARFHGDQEYLYNLLGEEWTRIPGIGSYKYHCRDGRPDDLRVIVFHGKPDPHEVNDPWILPYTSTLRSHINGSMQSGSNAALSAMAGS